jgi:hypothetical protein
MRPNYMAACLLVTLVPLAGCARTLDERDVREFIDKADDAARKRYGPAICGLRGENFLLKLTFQSLDPRAEPAESQMNRKLYCREAGKFSRIRQYRLERESLAIEVAPDRKTARAVAEYVETLPHYEENYMPATLDDFRDFVVVRSRDESIVGIEDGDLVFMSAEVEAEEIELLPKSSVDIPYE